MIRRAVVPVFSASVGVLVLFLLPSSASAQVLQVMPLFESRCAQCHGASANERRAPDRSALMQMTPERILAALTTGSMAANATGIADGQKRALAELLSGRPMGVSESGRASAMKGQCTAKPAFNPATGARWSGWGNDVMNSRMQTAEGAGLRAAQVPNLQLKWAFGFPNGSSAYGQPAVAGGRVFVGSDNGFVYALDAATGCVYWSFEAQAGAFGGLRSAVHQVCAPAGPARAGGRIECRLCFTAILHRRRVPRCGDTERAARDQLGEIALLRVRDAGGIRHHRSGGQRREDALGRHLR
jgi:hypothetical protein